MFLNADHVYSIEIVGLSRRDLWEYPGRCELLLDIDGLP